MKQIITKIYRSFKDKQGNPLRTKDGRDYERVAIKTQAYQDRHITGFGGDWNADWKVGDEVDIKIEQKGEYLNFSRIDRLDELEKRVKALEDFVQEPDDPEIGGHCEEGDPNGDLSF